MPSSPRQSRRIVSCDIFCNVIDNFGDAGVCWRLARQLTTLAGWSVRLIIDQPALIDQLHPDTQSRPDNLSIATWETAASVSRVPDVVIEAFGCRLPQDYLAALRATDQKVAWLNLEYLSAEGWIEGCHRLMSPDPVSGKPKYFFFPGFTALSGGLIREPWLKSGVQSFEATRHGRHWLASIGVATGEQERLISLFAYPNSPLTQLFRQFSMDSRPAHFLLAAGGIQKDLQKIMANAASEGVRVTAMPFFPQDDFDCLLATCDFNFVRGEDSFIRAQWIGHPFVWQAYRQDEDAHHIKLSAFLDLYLAKCESDVAAAIRNIHLAWNGVLDWQEGIVREMINHQSAIAKHNQQWANQIGSHGNLAENLAVFCESKL